METTVLEKDTLAEILIDPAIIKTEKMESEWFTLFPHQEIADALIALTATSEPTFYDIQEYIKKRNPVSVAAKEEYLLDMYSGVQVYGAKDKLKRLEQRHYERRLQQATKDFTQSPTALNGERVRKAIEELDKSRMTDTDGDFAEAILEIDHDLDHERQDGIMTYNGIDMTLAGGIQPARLIVIGARPGTGKSAIMNNLVIKAAERHPNIVQDIFTLEMTKKQLVSRFLSNLSEINSYRMANAATALNEQEKTRVRAKMRWLQSHNIKIYNKQHNVDSIIREIRKRAEGKKPGEYIAYIDYLQLVNVTDQNKSRHLQVGEVTRKLKLLGNELNVPIVVLSQLNRGLEARQDKRPTLSDLRESGDIEQDADIIMFLHPDEEDEGITNLIVAKNRDGQAGVALPFRFLKQTGHFKEDLM